jgi:hypothetical protein
MTIRTLLPAISVGIGVFFGVVSAPMSAFAQSVGPDEAINAPDAGVQPLALTAAQKSAVYNAIMQQRVHASSRAIPMDIGAPVSPSLELFSLPDEAAADAPGTRVLKYAMVEGNLVVVDPIGMRVVDVIHGAAKP